MSLQEAEGGPTICRICFEGDAAGELVTPCRCEGSQKYVHLDCLRRWQRYVQFNGPNYPSDFEREERHVVCNVCTTPFNLPPQNRAAMMSDLAGVSPEEMCPGMLLVTKKTSAEPILPGTDLNIAIRFFIEAKVAHFRKSVYLLTEIKESEVGDRSAAVFGVNLSRALKVTDTEDLDGGVSRETLQRHAEQGVEVLWMNGGPVKPRFMTSIVVVKYLPWEQRDSLFHEHGLELLIPGGEAAALGPLKGSLAVAAKEAQAAAAVGAARAAVVFAWAGVAQWSLTQLLGEVARGSWGWCQSTSTDLNAAAEGRRHENQAQTLWDTLRHSERLTWAPDNEYSREFESRFPTIPPAEQEPDPQAAAVMAFLHQFETMRRQAEVPARTRTTTRRQFSWGNRSCINQ